MSELAEKAELEAFDKWVTQETPTKEHISAQQLFDRIVTKLGHMIKTPKMSCTKPDRIKTTYRKRNNKMNVIWALKDLTIPKGFVEVMTANPPFYLTGFCISALIHISKHQDFFCTNIEENGTGEIAQTKYILDVNS